MHCLIISDLHANREALDAVLAHAHGQYDTIVCCGDIVGYGPDPNYVTDWVRHNVQTVIRGNHDRACCGIESLEWFNPVAQTASRWTMSELTAENLTWLRQLKQGPFLAHDVTLAHGSPLDEDEYVTTLSDAANIFEYLETNVTFFGHTHLQGGFSWFGGKQQFIVRPAGYEDEYFMRLKPEGLYLINPGSVGQPRDGDARAAYALYDPESRELLLRRVPYDHVSVARRIVRAGLPSVLGTRLANGR